MRHTLKSLLILRFSASLLEEGKRAKDSRQSGMPDQRAKSAELCGVLSKATLRRKRSPTKMCADTSWMAIRRSSRVVVDVPVEVYGQGSDGKMFHEETRTRFVSAHGALLSLATDVDMEQRVFVVCKKTGMETQCRVAYRKEVAKGEVLIGVEFLIPSAKFWGVAFPPEDWDPAERKRPEAGATRLRPKDGY